MSLRKNVLANYVSQLYVMVIGIVMVPLYVKYMGAEAYGLVGFFAMLQAWFYLLDMGLTPTMSREMARFNGGAYDALSIRRLLRALEAIFFGVAVLGAVAILLSSDLIASNWLKVQALPLVEVQRAIMLMAVIVSLRWISGLYRGAINGLEHQIWLSTLNLAVATARFVLVIPFFFIAGTTPTAFFFYQLVIAVLECLFLITKTYHLLPKVPVGARIPWQFQPLRNVLKFSLTIAFTSSIWVIVTQTDKLVLSKLLPLSDYAFYTIAVLVASGISMISGPISIALLPRLTRLSAENDEAGLIRLYRQATQFVGVLVIPASLVLALFAQQILWTWTGDLELAQKAAPVLSLYALGNGFLALGAFPYYFQYAKGDLKMHLIGNVLFVIFLIPGLIFATLRYGSTGAGYAWLSANAIQFFLWIPLVHRRFVNGLHSQWLTDVTAIALVSTIIAILCQRILVWPQGRFLVLIEILGISFIILAAAAAASSWVRMTVLQRWNRHMASVD